MVTGTVALTRSRFAGWRASSVGLLSVLLPCMVFTPSSTVAHEGHEKSAPKKARPALAVGAAFAPDGRLWVVGLDEQRRLTLRISPDDGRSWAAPRVLDIGSDVVAADGENRPKIAFGPRGWVVVSYTQPLAKPYTGEIRMLRSSDGGRSFSAPFTVHRDRQVITHRFESVAFDDAGNLHTVWIDKRDAEAARADAAKRGVKSTYSGAAIYRNVSADGGATFGPDIKLADHSCECCRIALAPAGAAGLVALWRHVFGTNVRDHAFARIGIDGAGPGEPVRATFDGWTIDACPHHGPGLAPAAGSGFHAVWFGVKAGESAVRYGRLTPTGEPVGSIRPLPDANAEHAAVASAGQAVALVWRSFDGQATALRAWLSSDNGATFVLRDLARSTQDTDHPIILTRDSRFFVIWRTADAIRVERLGM
jgi:hypothetical protein